MKFTKMVTVIAILLAATCFNANAATGIVTTDVLNLRSGTSYDSAVVGKVYKGSALNVKEYINGWYKIDHSGGSAYVSSDYVSVNVIGTGCVTYQEDIYLRNTPSWQSETFEKVSYGAQVSVTGVDGEFYEILYYGNIRYIPIICTNVRRDSLSDRSLASDVGSRAANIAEDYLGYPYVYGGSSVDGFDCSGFTMYVYSKAGVTLPHSAAAQSKQGVAVEKSDLLPGDLVFFSTTGSGVSHVGIYVGNGKMIHAPYGGKATCYDTISSGYYALAYTGARRVAR
ncbi:MAG: NlpC/P60 family protein [Bacillota bacterium]|nr:NlpC/P60 family protein [Bacillota bacterium]